MIGLDRLMKEPGVVAVEQFSTDGKTIRLAGEVPEDVMASISQLCADNDTRLRSVVATIAHQTGLQMTPLNGWMIWGGKYAVFVVNNTGVIIETRRANFNQLMVDMFISGPTGPGLMPS